MTVVPERIYPESIEPSSDPDKDTLKTNFVTDEAEWGFGIKAYQDQITVTGSGTQTLRLTYQPIPNSEHLYWNGNYQPGSEWSRDEWTVTIPDSGSVIESGDILVMEYLYEDPTPRPVIPATMTLVGYTDIGNNATSVDLPAGTMEGDVLLLAMATGGFSSLPTCSDSRITVSNVDAGQHYYTGFGISTSSASPIAVSSSDGEHNGHIVLAAYRVTGSIDTPVLSNGGATFAPTMPGGSPGKGLMVVASGSASGFSGSSAGTPQGSWVKDHVGVGSSVASAVWSSPSGVPAISTSPAGLASWRAIVIGVSDL